MNDVKQSLKNNLESILDGFNAVLTAHGIEGVNVENFRVTSQKKKCFKRVCREEKGKVICSEVEVPC